MVSSEEARNQQEAATQVPGNDGRLFVLAELLGSFDQPATESLIGIANGTINLDEVTINGGQPVAGSGVPEQVQDLLFSLQHNPERSYEMEEILSHVTTIQQEIPQAELSELVADQKSDIVAAVAQERANSSLSEAEQERTNFMNNERLQQLAEQFPDLAPLFAIIEMFTEMFSAEQEQEVDVEVGVAAGGEQQSQEQDPSVEEPAVEPEITVEQELELGDLAGLEMVIMDEPATGDRSEEEIAAEQAEQDQEQQPELSVFEEVLTRGGVSFPDMGDYMGEMPEGVENVFGDLSSLGNMDLQAGLPEISVASATRELF